MILGLGEVNLLLVNLTNVDSGRRKVTNPGVQVRRFVTATHPTHTPGFSVQLTN